MTQFYWRLPTAGDDRSAAFDGFSRDNKPVANATISDPRGSVYSLFDYLAQVARAAELTGFDGLIAPDDRNGVAPWIVVGAIAREVRRPHLIAEFSPGQGSAVYAAKEAVTFQRYSRNRLGWALRSAPEATERRALGDFANDTDLSRRLEEFLIVSKGVASQSDFTFKGDFFEVLKGGFAGPLSGLDLPEITLSGTDDAALALSAAFADVHALPLGTPDLAPRIGRLKALAADHGRHVRVGLKARVFVHDDGERAALEARRAGFEGDAATLIGSYRTVAEDIALLSDLGVDRFELFAPRSLETVYRVGEHVLPLLRQAHPKAA
ncbi:LLM class flavin-dependent oxidoreductase [Asticcacaulis excentricus]|uniref:Alkanesulfonate monooxygenase n=1 Tax=Asticcacaulis excentricus TaxID=78587 RepID=A0A3G9G2L4_9CAUL|nr:LLM class flavin-dependent oxidoreductase [Asticcacaulis excentricus]BBF81550.1 alkanesulfonate monooxygenase [Asticcacaulis excentricus]